MRRIYELNNIGDGILTSYKIYVEKREDGLFKIHDEYESIYLTENGAYDLLHALAEMLEFKLE